MTFLAAFAPGSAGRHTKPSWKRWVCAKRADRLRTDVSRIVAVSMAVDGHTVRQREITDEAVVIEQLVDLVREAAGLLGQATWFWAQTMNHEAYGDLTPS